MFETKTKAIKLFESQLKAFREEAIPFATRQAINGYAFAVQKHIKRNLESDFVLRNKFTQRSMRVTTTRSLVIREQESVVGSTADYMHTQEFGGIKSKTGKHGVTIPTAVAGGQAEGTKPRTKTPRPRFKMSTIRLSKKSKSYRSKRQANLVAIKEAAARSQKFVFLELNKHKGIFQISGSPKKPKIKMLYDMTNSSINIKAKPWLAPAVRETEKLIESIYFKALKFQLERHGLLKSL